MFDVGFSELVLIFVIGLLVLGPERLPKVASQIGRWVGRARRTATQLRHQLEREIALNELAESQKKQAPAAKPRRDETTADASTGAAAEAGPAESPGGDAGEADPGAAPEARPAASGESTDPGAERKDEAPPAA